MMLRRLPILRWLPQYGRKEAAGDLNAGLTVAIVLIPQGMAYGMLAGLPPVYGLYAAIAPLFVYALLGTSRQIAIGPVAADSLLVAVAASSVATAGSDNYFVAVALLALMVGAIQVLLGLCRFGQLVALLSRPVIAGFMSATAIVIALSQLKHLAGVPIPSATRVQDWVGHALQVESIHWMTLAVGLGACALLVAMRRLSKRFPGALVVVIVGIGAAALFGLEAQEVALVGDVPQGMPALRLPDAPLELVTTLFPSALGLALIGFMEAIGIGKAFARKNRYEIDADQELLALGVSNVAGSCLGGYPVTGGLSRSAVNADAGASTPLAGAFAGVLLCLSLLLLTPHFYHLPLAVLAAIVVTAVVRMIDVKTLVRLWKVRRSDALLFVFTFVVTLTTSMLLGIALGVAASVAPRLPHDTAHHAVLGRLPSSTNYRNLKYFPDAIETSGVKVWRFDASFYFANAEYFRDQVDALLLATHADEEQQDAPALPTIRALVIDASGINDLDASGASTLRDIVERLHAAQIVLTMANVKAPVRHVMERSGLRELIGPDRFFFSVHEAVQAAERALEELGAQPTSA